MKNILYCLALIATFIAPNIYGAEKTSPPLPPLTQQVAKPRIDVPITEGNFILYDVGYGGLLRIPKILAGIPEDKLKNIKQPIEIPEFQFSFLYPDMTLSDYPGDAQVGMEILNKIYKPKPDRFPVWIRSLFYSPGELGNVTRDEQLKVVMYRPSSMLRDAKIFAAITQPGFKTQPNVSDITPVEPIIINSKYQDLREVRFPIYSQDEKRIIEDAKATGLTPEEVRGHIYIGKNASPYELYLRCPGPDKCEAFVFIKENHFQYRMHFPPEALSHTDELLQIMNKMVGNWIIHQNSIKIK